MNPEIFRAYDIRGIVDSTLTEELVYQLGQALASLILERGETSLLIGFDGRLSSPRLRDQLAMGAQSGGCKVVDIGQVATPLLYFATHALNIPSGVMITGSHNPPEYNGLKILVGGEALYGAGIQNLKERMIHKQFCTGQASSSLYPIREAYLQRIQADCHLKRPLKIVVDCGNGVAGDFAPKLYQSLGCEVIPLYCEVDGNFPNHHPDPGQPENLKDLQKAVLEHGADLGLAFDGDGDRLGVVDNQGLIIWPDRLLMLFSRMLLQTHPKATIIFDVKCSRHVATEIEKYGGEPLMWKTGHSLIKAKMRETGALLAGEMSGHIFFKERWYGFDDALYAGARLLEILSQKTEDSATVFGRLPDSIATPELQIWVNEQEKFSLIERLLTENSFSDARVLTLDGARVEFKDGWGLIRPSNTTPCLISRFEGDTQAALSRIQALFRERLLALKPDLNLPF